MSALGILRPFREQIEFAVNERMTTSGDVAEKDAHLAVLHVPRRATILSTNACRFVTRFGKAGLVDGEDGLVRAQLFQCVGPQLIAHLTGIPDGRGEQPLHAVGRSFSGMFRQLPAIFAFHLTQDALQKGQGAPTGFLTRKVWRNAAMQVGEDLGPLNDVLERGAGFGEGGLLRRWHRLLLSSAVASRAYSPPK